MYSLDLLHLQIGWLRGSPFLSCIINYLCDYRYVWPSSTCNLVGVVTYAGLAGLPYPLPICLLNWWDSACMTVDPHGVAISNYPKGGQFICMRLDFSAVKFLDPLTPFLSLAFQFHLG